MEIHFQQPRKYEIPVSQEGNKFKGKGKNKNSSNNKYVGVRQRPSGRWVAEIKDTTKKIRMWLGTFETAEAAARAYDEAACLLRGSKTRTNFVTHHVSQDSPLASRVKNILDNRKKAAQSDQDSSASMSTNPSPSSSSSSGGKSGESNCTIDSFSFPDKAELLAKLTTHLFDDDYKPDLRNCTGESENTRLWGLEQGFRRFPAFPLQDHHNQLLEELSKNVGGSMAETEPENLEEVSEFELMRVERQISASLYAITGVQEYMETVHDHPIEPLWDLSPQFCSLYW